MVAQPMEDDIDPVHALSARLCLDDELFGPDQPLSEQEVHVRLAHLRGAERDEALELLSGHQSPLQQTFRERVDRVADLWPPAQAAAQSGVGVFHDWVRRGLGAWGLPNWGVLVSAHGTLQRDVAARNRLDVLKEPIVELEPVWHFIDAVSDLLTAYPALASLPWVPDWILRLAQDRPPQASYRTDWTRPLSVIGGGGMRTVRFQPPDPTLPLVEVDRSKSREETRQRLIAASERLLYPIYLQETDRPLEPVPDAAALRRDRGFRRWLRNYDDRTGTGAALESMLDESHPPGTRPHTREPLPRIRRDVALWAQVEIWDRSDVEVASNNEDRYDNEPTFRSYTGGRRPRLPTTPKGVRDAIGRAQRLLQEPEI